MSISNIVFILSVALFSAYTVVSLHFLRKKRIALRNTLHDAVEQHMTNNGDIEPSGTTAMALLRQMDAQFQDFNNDEQEVHYNIIKCAFLTALIGVCYAFSIILS